MTTRALVAAIGIPIAIAIVIATVLSYNVAEDARGTVNLERAGLARAALLRGLLEHTASYREIAADPAASGPEVLRAAARVDADVAAIGALEEHAPLIGSDWGAIVNDWHAYRAGGGSGPAGPLLDLIVRAPEKVSDQSHLTTDLSQVALDVSDALTYRIPAAIENAYEFQNLLRRRSASSRESLRRTLDLAAETAVADNIFRSAFEDLDEAVRLDPAVALAAAQPLTHAEQDERTFVQASQQELVQGGNPNGGDLRSLTSRAIQSHYALFDALVPALDAAFAARLGNADRQRLATIVPGLLAIVAQFIIVFLLARMLHAGNELSRVRGEAARVSGELTRIRAEARYAAVFRSAEVGIVLLDADGALRDANPAIEQILRVPPGALAGRSIFEYMHADDVNDARWLLSTLFAGSTESMSAEQRYRRADGTTAWVNIALSLLGEPEDSRKLAIGLLHDVTERKRTDERLVHAATHDSLTGLPNRALFVDRLATSLAKRNGKTIGVLFVDIDNFKLVNDNFGHVVGDAVLRGVAERLSTPSTEETVARMGGDEFAVLVNSFESRAALQTRVEDLLARLREPFVVDGREVHATASIGVAVAGRRHDNADDLLRDADAAMYEAKAAGRARAEFFDVRAHSGIAERKEMVAEMHVGLERGEFVVVYQPIVRLRGGQVLGYEALLRWQHPRLGLLTPARFLSTATVSGTIVGLGRFVLGDALRCLAELRRTGNDAFMHVNVSVPEIMQPDLDTFLADALRAVNVPPRTLVLEITESSIVESNFATRRMFERLRKLGVGLTVDDFGVGYSSLRYLNDLPVTGIKIDGSFVRGVGGELASEPIVRMLVELARSLDLSLIAECIETPQQLDALVRLGCSFGQGYLLGEPLPAPVSVAANW